MKFDEHRLAEDFWRDGFVVIDDFFDAKLMDDCCELILQHYGHAPDLVHSGEFIANSETEVVPWFPLKLDVASFQRMDRDPDLKRATTCILGKGWQDLACMVMFSKTGSKGQSWHQDCPPEKPRHFNLNRLVYTHGIDPANGGQTVVVPGSHKMGLLPKGEPHQDIDGQLVLAPKKGTLVLLHGHTWHRVLNITGSHWRASTNLRVVPQGVPAGVTDIGIYRNMRYRFSTREILENR